MDLEDFKASLRSESPPHEDSKYLSALWYEAKGDWEKAHEYVQSEDTTNGAWIHGYLHRKEGDSSNARYWYSKAHKKFPEKQSVENEWENIVVALLGEASG